MTTDGVVQGGTGPAGLRRLAPEPANADATLWALLPWLGIPYLVSAELARAGHALPGRILPVAAFLPLVGLAYWAAVAAPTRRRLAIVACTGIALLALLMARLLLQSEHGGGKLALGVAAALTLASLAACYAIGRRWIAWLAAPLTLAVLLSQALDGWLTYLAVGNPFGWLEEPAREQVHVSAFILEHAPFLFPVLKTAVALAVAAGLRKAADPRLRFALALAICYVGLQPALFSAANLLAR